MFKMLLMNCVFLIAVANKISGMASLGNGSMKKISVRAKIAKFCGQNPALCRFKMEMQEVKKSSKDKRIFHQNVDKEIGEEEEDPRQKTIKITSKSNMLCRFTVEANYLITVMANNMKKKVNDIILDIKNLIQDLLLLPQAIIVCRPKVQKHNIPIVKTRPNNAVKVQDILRDVIKSTKDGSLYELENDMKKNTQKNEVSANRDFAVSEGNTVEVSQLNKNNPQNLPWKDVEYQQHFKRLYHALKSNSHQNYQNLPWKDESKTQKHQSSSGNINPDSSPINLPWEDVKEIGTQKKTSHAIKSGDIDAEGGKIVELLEDILQHIDTKVDQKSV